MPPLYRIKTIICLKLKKNVSCAVFYGIIYKTGDRIEVHLADRQDQQPDVRN